MLILLTIPLAVIVLLFLNIKINIKESCLTKHIDIINH